jgi:integrase/recombinase XerD
MAESILYDMDSRLRSQRRFLKEDKFNKKSILKYEKYNLASGLSKQRTYKYFNLLRVLSERLNKPFENATKDDIINLAAWIEQRNISFYTKKDYKITLKRFYKWLKCTEDYPSEVKWLKTGTGIKNKKFPKDLLTENDIENIISNAKDIRNKAFVMLLYETGARISEIINIKIKDIDFDQYGSKIIIDGKTGMRRIRVIKADPYLRQYLDTHYAKNNKNAYFWLKSNQTKISHSAIGKMIKKLVAMAGIKKSIHAHTFRHSRASTLANYLTEAQMCAYLGWVQGSNMPSVYIHMNASDLDNKLLQLNGIEIEGNKIEKETKMAPKKCPRCKISNAFDAKFCTNCGMVLDMSTAVKLDEMKKIEKDVLTESKFGDIKKEFFEWLANRGS